MNGIILTENRIRQYRAELILQEKSPNTISKYMRDVRRFYAFLCEIGQSGCKLTKDTVIRYKEYLQRSYRTSSVNSMLVAANRLLQFLGANDCCVKTLKCQRQVFREEAKELTKQEYLRLVAAAQKKHNERLSLLLQTICSTGIRVSELQYITVEAARNRRAEISCKGKSRTVFISKELSKRLILYCGKQGISRGYIFCTSGGKALDRSNIWSDMKSLCAQANVEESKVFPHNLRHLFARTFYGIDRDIVRLADILGHSNIDTTRIYIISSGAEHAKTIARLGLLA